MARFAVIDDYGDDWEEGMVAHEANTLAEAEEWAEGENFHSASIVTYDAVGNRVKVN